MKDRSEKTAIIFIGIQASGKSTFYQERFEDYVHINLDTLHTRNKEKMLLQEGPKDQYDFGRRSQRSVFAGVRESSNI